MNFFSPAALVAFVCLFFATSTPHLKAAGAPFHGKCSAVDTSAQTITLVGKKKTRVFHVLPTTKIVDGASNPSSLSAATPGEAVSGYYDTTTMNLSMLRIGAKTGSKTAKKEAAEESAPAASTSAPAPAAAAPAAAPAAAASPEPAAATTSTKAKKSRFSGKVASVNVAGNSVVVHGETVMVDSSTKMIDATGAAITLSDLAAGDKISGSAMKAADGTMTAVTLKKAK
jgi:hypothetical protein